MIRNLAAHLFGCHVVRGSHHAPGFGSVAGGRGEGRGIGIGAWRFHRFGQAEVENLDGPVPCDEEIFRFEVAMNHVFAVSGGEAPGNLQGELGGLAGRQGPVCKLLAQGIPLEEFTDEVGLAVVLSHVEHHHDVRVVQRSQGAGFPFESLQALPVAGKIPGQHLDGDLPVQPGVGGTVHLSHRPGANAVVDLVMGNSLPGHWCRVAAACFGLKPLPRSRGASRGRSRSPGGPSRPSEDCPEIHSPGLDGDDEIPRRWAVRTFGVLNPFLNWSLAARHSGPFRTGCRQ